MKHNVILIVLDGLNYDVARHAMGHLQAWHDAGRQRCTNWSASYPPSPARCMNAY